MNVYRSVREKQGIVVSVGNVFTNSDISGCFFTSISKYDLLKMANFNLQQEAKFLLWKNYFPGRGAEIESTSSSKLKGAWPNVRTESSSQEINNATISKSREQFLYG